MIDLSQLKQGDTMYAINSGSKPIVYKMIIDSVISDEHIFTTTYNIKVMMPDNSYKFIEFHKPSKDNSLIENKAYIKSLNNSIISEYDKDNTFIVGFDKNTVINNYINDINKHILLIEETINRGKNNLVELNEKLNYIQKQII